jgi:peptide deformylase
MPVRPVIRMGNPILRMIAKEVDPSQITSEEIQSIIKDLEDTMVSANGLGIAAPQIAISLQICIIEVP